MKLNPNSTRPRIFDGGYEHPWYKYENIYRTIGINLVKKPNPPTQQAVDKAQFRDKTFEWNRSSDNRPRGKRSTK
jgi:hypothetical protein